MAEPVMEVEHYRWADDERSPADRISTSRDSTDTAYRWTAIRQPPDAADSAASAPIIVPPERAPKRAPTSEHAEHTRAEKPRPKRTVSSMVRFTPDEFLLVAERARACGRPPARYIREAALGSVPKAKKTAGSAELIRELSAIGNTLQELRAIARDAAGEAVAARCETVLLRVLDAIRRAG
jgi:mobilization protein NikA